jgi:hypothetical protein
MSTQLRRAHGLAGAAPREPKHDARRRKRLKVSLPVHLRPFDIRFRDIEDVGLVVDFTRDGLQFTTCMPHYLVGMRLEVTFPYGDKVAAHRKFLGLIVRTEDHENGTTGVSVRFLL